VEKKIILVTGASSGIGKETALTLAKQGHTIIMHGRDEKKTQQVFEEVKAESGNADIYMYTADLSLKAEVVKMADLIKDKFDHIDVLINNAGGQFGKQREVTVEGHEKTFAINVLAPFLLTNRLLPLVKKSKSGRIITVCSESVRQGGKVLLDDIEFAEKYSISRSYGLTKRYAWWIMRQYAKNLQAAGINNVTVNCLEPGSAITGLQRVSGEELMMKVVMALWKPLFQSVEKAAQTSIYLATSEEVEGVTGKFFGNCKEKTYPAKLVSDEGQKGIWDYCYKACSEYLE